MEEQNVSQTQTPQEKVEEAKEKKIVIRMWPKTPVVYPLALLALIFCIIGSLFGSAPHLRALARAEKAAMQAQSSQAQSEHSSPESDNPSGVANQTVSDVTPQVTHINYEETAKKLITGRWVDQVMGIIFLIVFAFCLFTLCVDIEIRWALFAFTSTIVVLLVIYILNERYDFMPNFLKQLATLTPTASPQFYLAIFVIWLVLMVISFAIVRFHYVEIESNEVIVVGGLLERQQRFPTTRMQYVKDIQDVFEYYLPFIRSGRLVLIFPDQHETLVVDNVLNIDKVITELNEMSGVLQVSGFHK